MVKSKIEYCLQTSVKKINWSLDFKLNDQGHQGIGFLLKFQGEGCKLQSKTLLFSCHDAGSNWLAYRMARFEAILLSSYCTVKAAEKRIGSRTLFSLLLSPFPFLFTFLPK